MRDVTTPMAAPVSLYRPAGTGRVERVMGTAHVYKAKSAETGGSFSCFEAVVPPGTAVPAHQHHDEDEAFYCLEGEIVLDLEGIAEPVRLRQGDFCFSPRGCWHAFRNEGTVPARALVIVTPGNRIEQMFAELEAAGAGAVLPMEQLAGIVQRHGVTPVGQAA